ncbi:hypothetical protein CEXT_250731 [Caerostris extrusa]|uniref:Uncharacterized protein n=1 Tax=Caerostris extrusa TaxID=172846 RepID=A0AAV4PSE0_CAEEX|nr:hypothetical protein CEXT_250731 [Caerostris extrusa]
MGDVTNLIPSHIRVYGDFHEGKISLVFPLKTKLSFKPYHKGRDSLQEKVGGGLFKVGCLFGIRGILSGLNRF